MPTARPKKSRTATTRRRRGGPDDREAPCHPGRHRPSARPALSRRSLARPRFGLRDAMAGHRNAHAPRNPHLPNGGTNGGRSVFIPSFRASVGRLPRRHSGPAFGIDGAGAAFAKSGSSGSSHEDDDNDDNDGDNSGGSGSGGSGSSGSGGSASGSSASGGSGDSRRDALFGCERLAVRYADGDVERLRGGIFESLDVRGRVVASYPARRGAARRGAARRGAARRYGTRLQSLGASAKRRADRGPGGRRRDRRQRQHRRCDRRSRLARYRLPRQRSRE